MVQMPKIWIIHILWRQGSLTVPKVNMGKITSCLLDLLTCLTLNTLTINILAPSTWHPYRCLHKPRSDDILDAIACRFCAAHLQDQQIWNMWFIQVLGAYPMILHHWIFICQTYRLRIKYIYDPEQPCGLPTRIFMLVKCRESYSLTEDSLFSPAHTLS